MHFYSFPQTSLNFFATLFYHSSFVSVSLMFLRTFHFIFHCVFLGLLFIEVFFNVFSVPFPSSSVNITSSSVLCLYHNFSSIQRFSFCLPPLFINIGSIHPSLPSNILPICWPPWFPLPAWCLYTIFLFFFFFITALLINFFCLFSCYLSSNSFSFYTEGFFWIYMIKLCMSILVAFFNINFFLCRFSLPVGCYTVIDRVRVIINCMMLDCSWW